MSKKNTPVKWVLSHYDVSLVLLILFLGVFGLIMIYSTSYFNANYYYNEPMLYFKSQTKFLLIGFAAMLIISLIDYHWYFRPVLTIKRVKIRLIWLLYIGCMALQFYVLKKGYSANGSSRWVKFEGLGGFQPSEATKMCFVLLTSFLCVKYVKKFKNLMGIIIVTIIMLPLLYMVSKQNLSSAIIMFGIMFTICFVVSQKRIYYVGMIPIGAGAVWFLISNVGYRAERIILWQNPELDPGSQIMQGLYAIASGGLMGKGLGNSVQKERYIQEVHTDMIFTVICEELGIIGAIAVITVFLLLLLRIFKIALNSADKLGRLIATGVFAQIAIQLLLNIAVVTNTIPATGVPLPFISYGGSSLLILLAEMGVVLNISKCTTEPIVEE